MPRADRTADVIVVGGGLAGAAAAVVLARRGLETIHLAPRGPADRRTSALMSPAVEFLAREGLLSGPEEFGEPLKRIRIIDATGRLMRAPEVLFDSHEAGLSAFGRNFGNAALLDHFSAVADTLPSLTRLASSYKTHSDDGGRVAVATSNGERLLARLVVGADGKRSAVRETAGIPTHDHQFRQSALVCDLELGRPLDGTSVEFHYPNGPFTLVPAGGHRANLVWIDTHATLVEARDADRVAFESRLRVMAQNLFAGIILDSDRVVFPLSTLRVNRAGQGRTILVGEAAHAFPPIGAQGLNLGLRDVADLATVVTDAGTPGDGWAERVTKHYARSRAADLFRTGTMVNSLFGSLLSEMLPAQMARAGGLWALRTLPPLRKRAFAVGMGRN